MVSLNVWVCASRRNGLFVCLSIWVCIDSAVDECRSAVALTIITLCTPYMRVLHVLPMYRPAGSG